MMTPKRRVQKQQRPHRHLIRPLSTWQRLVLGGYSALVALFLPLICAGAAAEPGHPHRYPHFVFVEPLQHHAPQSQPLAHAAMRKMPASSAHQGGSHEAMVRVKQSPATCPLYPNGAVAGRATLALLVFSILLLLALADWVVQRLDWPNFVLWRHLHGTASLALPVPLPPPRLYPARSW